MHECVFIWLNLHPLNWQEFIKSRPYFCHEQAPVLGTFSFLYYFQQKISQPLHHGAPWNWTQSEGETKSSQNDSTHSEALSSLGLLGVHCHQRGFGEIFFSYWPRQEAKAWPGLPALASPTLSPVHQSSQRKTFLHSKRKMIHRWEPQAAKGQGVGGIISETLSFGFTSNSMFKELHDEVLVIFFAGNSKENCKSLKPVSVHDRNKA